MPTPRALATGLCETHRKWKKVVWCLLQIWSSKEAASRAWVVPVLSWG